MYDVARAHQLKIARATLKMSDEGAMIMGGMTKDEARKIINNHYARLKRQAVRDICGTSYAAAKRDGSF